MSEACAPNQNCPRCGSTKLWWAGQRYHADGTSKQRYLCRVCGCRFSQTENLRDVKPAVSAQKGVKNLDAQTQMKEICAGDGNLLEYAWLLKK